MVSDEFSKEWHDLLGKGPYFTMDQWMEAMNAENQQAVIYEAESDVLAHKLNMKSSQGGYKVSLVWLPERMNLTCANKLLKLLEEPPQQTVFLLVSEEPELLLETIRSRVQRFDVHRIGRMTSHRHLPPAGALARTTHTASPEHRRATGSRPPRSSMRATRTASFSTSLCCS